MVAYIVSAILAYAIGSIMFSVIVSRKLAGFDVREKGSKNAGSTNMLRTVGKKGAIITLICDILKGVIAILIAMLIAKIANITEPSKILLMKYIAGFAVILGHTYPIFFEFRGGKGVATSLGVLLMLNWKIGLIALIFALLFMAFPNMVSVGSISAANLYQILVLFIEDRKNFGVILISWLIAILVIFNHRTNIKRLKEGKENKISFSKR